MKALHSAATAEHGTPPHIVEGGRNLMGGVIHLDPFSSAVWNRRVRALRFYDKRLNAFKRPWAGNLLVNPPGGEQGRLVQAAWMRLIDFWLLGDVAQAIWVGFSLEQLASLQGLTEDRFDVKTMTKIAYEYPSPLDFPTLLPRRRLHYQEKKGLARTTRRSDSPTHASYVSWLPPIRHVKWRHHLTGVTDFTLQFVDTFGYLGKIVEASHDQRSAAA